MKIITYLGFTLISILVQFCVMDFIQERLHDEEKPIILNSTSPKKQFPDLLQEYASKPHALYYRTGITPINRLTQFKNISVSTKIYNNTSKSETLSDTTTAIASTTFEELYDDNSVTEYTTTTESFYTSTETDNVTEFILFEKKNKSNDQTDDIPKRKIYKNECDCNFLFNVCDINCCCDNDCSDVEIKLFTQCIMKDLPEKQNNVCYPKFSANMYTSNVIDNFLCIAKTNLPEKRNINIKYDPMFVSRTQEITVKWLNTEIPNINKEFTKNPYVYGDPIWLLKNGSIVYLDVSSPMINNYCAGRKQVKFLKEDKITCSIKLTHLEMIQTLKTVDETSIISVVDSTVNR